MQTELEKLISLYRELEIDKQIDYDKLDITRCQKI